MRANLLFILTGSIACYKACDAISRLVQRGHRVRVVATEAALKFVGSATLEGLTRERVATDTFADGRALEHIDLARWADAIVLCPATANTLNKIAAGLGDDLASTLLLAHDWKKPLLIAPAMNPAMWQHPATVVSVARLRTWGARFIDVGTGRTACGEVGEGRLAEPAQIVAAIEEAVNPPARRLRVLVTSGGTAEPIDAVRVITNTSTGSTGTGIAAHLAHAGHDVVLVRARTAPPLGERGREVLFTTFGELDAALAAELREHDFDAVIHAAAVSDFSVESIEADGVAVIPGRAKLNSAAPPILRLRANPKLLDTLRRRSRNPHVRVVAFKLTQQADASAARAAVMALFAAGAADLVVHNDLAARTSAGVFPAEIWDAAGELVARCPDRPAIAPALEALLLAGRDPELHALNPTLPTGA